jgi:hypothetical protein
VRERNGVHTHAGIGTIAKQISHQWPPKVCSADWLEKNVLNRLISGIYAFTLSFRLPLLRNPTDKPQRQRPTGKIPARCRLRVSGGWMPIVFCIERRPLSPINPTEGFPSHPYRSL